MFGRPQPSDSGCVLADQDMIRGHALNFHLWLTFWDVVSAYVALGLLILVIRSFESSFDRVPDPIRRLSFIADMAAVSAVGLAVAGVAGAILAWAA